MRNKYLFCSIIFLIFLFFPTHIFAGDLYHLSLQAKAREQGWIGEAVEAGRICKYREPTNAEIAELEVMCEGISICLADIIKMKDFEDCATFGRVAGIKDGNIVFESINRPVNVPEEILLTHPTTQEMEAQAKQEAEQIGNNNNAFSKILNKIVTFFKGLLDLFHN